MSSEEDDESTDTDIFSIRVPDDDIYMTKGKKKRVLAYRLLAHQVCVANCLELFTEVFIRAKKEMLVYPSSYAKRIVDTWACRLKALEDREKAPPSIDLENSNLKVELYTGHRTLKYELERRRRWMEKIQKEIATMEVQGRSVKDIVMVLIGVKKYHNKFWAALDANKADTFYRRDYWRRGGIVCPNGFTTGGVETIEEAREENERTRNKYSYYL